MKDRIGAHRAPFKRPSHDAQTWICSQSSVASASKTLRKSAPPPIALTRDVSTARTQDASVVSTLLCRRINSTYRLGADDCPARYLAAGALAFEDVQKAVDKLKSLLISKEGMMAFEQAAAKKRLDARWAIQTLKDLLRVLLHGTALTPKPALLIGIFE